MTTPSATSSLRAELFRCGVLVIVAAWLLHPFATGRMIGTGDALWYAQMLGDFITQLRAGEFPIFVGQTEWAWNGAVYPLRVAPLYQHMGGLIDLLTGQRLGLFALQHAIVIVSGSLGLVSAYLCLRKIDPTAPWRACLLACLYLSCPGVLGTIYTQDLYMTWMVLPFPPLALLGTVGTFDRDDIAAQLLLAVGLAGAWLAHAPVALWLTLIAGSAQALRLLVVHRRVASWRRALVGVGAFAILGGYPFVSVAMLGVPGAASAVASGLANDQQITQAIREVFPRVLQPLSDSARALSDLQLGYGLWLVAATVVVMCVAGQREHGEARRERLPVAFLLVACASLLVLLLPVPFITEWLWNHVPGQIKRITFYWPMHRFYLLLAVLLVTALQLAARGLAPRTRTLVLTLAGVALAWSLWESRQFARAGRERTASAAVSERALRPENRMLMNHAYGLFASLPDRFTNGVTDPRAEFRLLDAKSGRELSAVEESGEFTAATGHVDANPGILRLDRELTLESGARYALDFRFGPHDYTGILQLTGTTFFREYQLPRSGSALAFGSKPGNASTLHLWTTSTAPERITLRFIPTAPDAKPADFQDFGELRLRKIDPANEPIELLSLAPLRFRIRVEKEATLATPRMALLGYRASVDGNPTRATSAADGTFHVTVPGGEHRVEVAYDAPWPVSSAYWIALVGWTALIVFGAWALVGRQAPVQR